jgi:hypothetical protein
VRHTRSLWAELKQASGSQFDRHVKFDRHEKTANLKATNPGLRIARLRVYGIPKSATNAHVASKQGFENPAWK